MLGWGLEPSTKVSARLRLWAISGQVDVLIFLLESPQRGEALSRLAYQLCTSIGNDIKKTVYLF